MSNFTTKKNLILVYKEKALLYTKKIIFVAKRNIKLSSKRRNKKTPPKSFSALRTKKLFGGVERNTLLNYITLEYKIDN